MANPKEMPNKFIRKESPASRLLRKQGPVGAGLPAIGINQRLPGETLSIGSFAQQAGVNVETIRFYQRKGLLPQPVRPYGGIRRYGAADVARVRFVKSAQRLGFSLEEVAELLKLEDGAHCDDARVLAEGKLADVRAKLADLRRIESALSGLIEGCGTNPGGIACPLIAALQAREAGG